MLLDQAARSNLALRAVAMLSTNVARKAYDTSRWAYRLPRSP
jgi:hypothetical protein